MTLWCCAEPMRLAKSQRIMDALAAGIPGARVCVGSPPQWPAPLVIYGHRWLAETLVPLAIREDEPWWFIDNGFFEPARGTSRGYYSIMYRSPTPILLANPDMERLPLDWPGWREPGRRDHVLLAMPGDYFGRPFGIDTTIWREGIKARIRAGTRRRIVVRDKGTARPLSEDLSGCAVVVTHSSKVAVDAIRRGIPVCCAPTCAAAPVAGSVYTVGDPVMAEPEVLRHWWASLMCQQWTLAEMRAGLAWPWMRQCRDEAQAG